MASQRRSSASSSRSLAASRARRPAPSRPASRSVGGADRRRRSTDARYQTLIDADQRRGRREGEGARQRAQQREPRRRSAKARACSSATTGWCSPSATSSSRPTRSRSPTPTARRFPATVVAYDHATGFGLVRPMARLTPKPIRLGTAVPVVAARPPDDRHRRRGADHLDRDRGLEAASSRATGNTSSTARSSPRRRASTTAAPRSSTRTASWWASARSS